MTPDQIIAAVMALVSGHADPTAFSTIRAGGADTRYPVTVEACPRPLPAGEIEGQTVICGRVDLPEVHGKADSRRISLAFAVLKARTQSPAPDPVVYLHGGPGGGAVKDLWSIVVPIFDQFRARRDLVTFDQRAAGISSDMVTCFDTLGANIVSLMAPGAVPESTPEADVFARCLDEMKAKSGDITAYNTTQNAFDTQAILRALGYADWNLYGISYGTQLALEVMRSAPEGTRSVVIDSVFPPDVKGYDENIKPLQESIQATLDQCAADPACAAAYPDLEGTLVRVAAKLQANPIPAARGRGEITLKALIDLFDNRNSSGAWPQITAHVPLILTELERGETTTWDMLTTGGTRKVPTSAERLAGIAAKLTPEQTALATLLLDHAAAERVDDAAMAAALSALSDSLGRSQSGASDLAARFDAEVTRSIIGSGSREAMLDFVVAYAGLTTQTPSRQGLRDLVEPRLPAADLAPILALIDLMSDADIRAVYAAVAGDARKAYAPMMVPLDLMVIACQEQMPFNTIEGFNAYNATLKWPWLTQSNKADASMYGICTLLPPAPRPEFLTPVSSDIPTMVVYGLNDTQTSSADARHAAETLSRSQVIEVPEAGHGSIIFSQCVKDIGMAFIERPETAPDTACLASLKPKFVLPPG
ncbi:alpha/beta hydrolase [Paragemmobacter straminiformis]|uniref:Alpha/beta fold hydrolase n=1 Tax=Paragemmobacter straminiformis TaxID=2045119 RepID=A0A842IBA1_9RHOB|nr:alpha/beta fold hydrolase [Gemmobacter straminiformis]MBC2836683.1 alpha/beta fold hydrolase [Gemmobacter straminiformis]